MNEDQGLNKEFSRREFLKGASRSAAVGAVVVATGGGVLPQLATEVRAEAVASRPPVGAPDLFFMGDGGTRIDATRVNVQDYSVRDTTSNFDTLFSPVSIGSHTFSHRMMKSAAGSGTQLAAAADPDFRLGREMLEYYVNMARGGMEFIWVEPLAGANGINSNPLPERPEGEPAQFAPMLAHNEEFFRQLVAECGRYGCKLGMQVAIGGIPFTGPVPLTDTSVTVDTIKNAHHMQLAEHARRLHSLGFIGIEINAAGFNAGRMFLSRFSNTRTDEYGPQSFENRARWVTEGIQSIKAAVNDPDFVVQILINCIEELDLITSNRGPASQPFSPPFRQVASPRNDVMTIEEGIELAKLFEAAGADSMHLRMAAMNIHLAGQADMYWILPGLEGHNGYGFQWDYNRHWQGLIRGNNGGIGATLDVCRRYKEALSIPCGTVTYMDPAAAPELFEQALADGCADFLLFKRPLDVDPEYINKLREGRKDEILMCTRCSHCHVGGGNINDVSWYCRTNAMLQRVHRPLHIEMRGHPTSYELPPAEQVKNVMVVGGGPGGMEAARVAAERGHNVTLYERTGRLGGLMHFAAQIKGPHENLQGYIKWHERQLELKGVNVVTGQEVTPAFINSADPDALIIATGAVYDTLSVPTDGSVPIIPYEQFVATNMGDTVLIWGAGALGFDAALWLTVRGKKVVMVTDRPILQILEEQGVHAQRMMLTALYSLGLRVWSEASINRVEDGRAFVTSNIETETSIACDTILDASRMLPNRDLASGVNVSETYVIGDADAPFNIARAVHHGNDIGRTV